MTFAEILQEVYNITSRPDLDTLTKSAVKAATLKAHQSDFFAKDVYETQFVFPSSEYIQSFDYFSFIPNYRAIKYLREYSIADKTPGKVFKLIDTAELFDEWNREKTDVFYVAGNIINIRSSTEFYSMIVSAYLSPTVIETNYSSWVADLFPYAIIYEAARVIFSTKSQDAEKNSMAALVSEQYAELKINATIEQGS